MVWSLANFFLCLPTRKKKENAFYLCKYLSRQLKSAIVSQTQLSKKFACPDAHTALHREVLRSHNSTLNHVKNKPNHFECEFLSKSQGAVANYWTSRQHFSLNYRVILYSKSILNDLILHHVHLRFILRNISCSICVPSRPKLSGLSFWALFIWTKS